MMCFEADNGGSDGLGVLIRRWGYTNELSNFERLRVRVIGRSSVGLTPPVSDAASSSEAWPVMVRQTNKEESEDLFALHLCNLPSANLLRRSTF